MYNKVRQVEEITSHVLYDGWNKKGFLITSSNRQWGNLQNFETPKRRLHEWK